MKTSSTGTYIYDKKTGKLVKVSDKIPSCSKNSKGHSCCGNCCCGHHD